MIYRIYASRLTPAPELRFEPRHDTRSPLPKTGNLHETLARVSNSCMTLACASTYMHTVQIALRSPTSETTDSTMFSRNREEHQQLENRATQDTSWASARALRQPHVFFSFRIFNAVRPMLILPPQCRTRKSCIDYPAPSPEPFSGRSVSCSYRAHSLQSIVFSRFPLPSCSGLRLTCHTLAARRHSSTATRITSTRTARFRQTRLPELLPVGISAHSLQHLQQFTSAALRDLGHQRRRARTRSSQYSVPQ